MEYKRNVRFEYFQIWVNKISPEGKKSGKSELFNLVDWIDKIKRDGLEQKSLDIGSAKARIDCCKYDKGTDTWAIRFMRLRDTNVPSKVKDNHEAEVIELDDGEYFGEDITMIYEKKSGIAMIQCNRFSLGISKIEELLWTTYGENDIFISIVPIADTKDKKYSNKNNYKTFEITFANIQKWKPEKSKACSFNSFMDLVKKFDGYIGKVSISLGHSKEDTLCRDESVEFIKDLQENREYVRSAKVKWQKNDGTGDDSNDVEIINLFDNIFQDIVPFTIMSKEALDFNTVVAEMEYCFSKKKSELYAAIQYRAE